MSRTTNDLDSTLIHQLNHLAAGTLERMPQVVNRSLRGALKPELEVDQERVRFQWNVVQSGLPAADFDPASRESRDLLHHRTH